MIENGDNSAPGNKRPAEETVPEATPKKQHVDGRGHDHFAGLMAPVKAEYVITSAPTVAFNDDEAEEGDRAGEPKGKNKKKRGQNKNRELKQRHEEVRLCHTLVDPENVLECRFGAEKCRCTHNVDEYLEAKGPDLEGECPVFKAIGYCPAGLKCRWLGSHYNKQTNRLVRDLERIEEAKKTNFEVNKVEPEVKYALQKKTYVFETSDKVIAYIDSVIPRPNQGQQKKDEDEQNHETSENATEASEAQGTTQAPTPQETVKDNSASYTEPPFTIAEKKRLHLGGAKIVSPLTTVGNLPYRRLMKTLGADVTYSEMALSMPLVQGTNSEWALPKAHNTEYPGFGVQIAASKHWPAAKAAEILARETSNVSELNLNCGCPIDLLFRQGQGLALMDQPPKLLRILKSMNACSGDIPVTVKIRTGVKDNKNTAKNLAERLMGEGDVAAITLHGRSRQQRYTREADWAYIGEVGLVVKAWNDKKEEDKDRSDAPLTWFIGNGDVFTHEDWYRAVNTEGIDSVMVARGALIKPWIFEEVNAQQYLDKSATERLDMLRQYADFAVEHWGADEYGISQARRFMCEFMSFTHRYIPIGILEHVSPKLNQRPPQWKGRNELETLLGSTDYKDWIKVTEMFLGKASDSFQFTPKHKANL